VAIRARCTSTWPDRSRSVKIFPWSHAAFSNLKSWLRGTYHGVSRKYLPRYLDEFSFRFNLRGNEASIAIERVLQASPCPYHRLEAELTG